MGLDFIESNIVVETNNNIRYFKIAIFFLRLIEHFDQNQLSDLYMCNNKYIHHCLFKIIAIYPKQ